MEPNLVAMGEYKVVKNPGVLTCVGLGSCIGLVLYDALRRIGGLAHIVLPKRSAAKNQSRPGKFADSAIALMLEKMERLGATKSHVWAKMFGGANMFPGVYGRVLLSVGDRNVEVVEQELSKRKIKIVAKDVRGHLGRTIIFDARDGSVHVRNIHGEDRMY